MKDQTLVLATHQLRVLEHCVQIVWMENGRIRLKGCYKDVIEDPDFAKFVGTHSYKDSEASDVSEIVTPSEPPQALPQATDLIQKEDRAGHSVEFSVVMAYLRASGSASWLPVAYLLSIISQLIVILSAIWLAFFVGNHFPQLSTAQYIAIYIGITLTAGVFPFGYACFVQISSTRAANAMTTRALTSVLRAPISWFDTQPVGRILSRFTSDCAQLDNESTI